MAIGEVDGAVGERAVERFLELDPPARLAFLGLEEGGLLRPFGDRIGAAEFLVELGLVFGPGLRIFDQVFAQRQQ